MRVFKIFSLIIGLSLFTGCLPTEEESDTSLASQEDSAHENNDDYSYDGNPVIADDDSEDGDENENEDEDSNPPPLVSQPDSSAQYMDLGQAIEPTPDPLIEPNTDYTIPIIEISERPQDFIGENQTRIGFRAADNVGGSGLKEIQCRIDAGGWQSCGPLLELKELEEGEHHIFARSEDWDDNQSTEVSCSFTVDLTPPLVQIDQAPPASTTEDEALFHFSASDEDSGVSHYECSVNGQDFQACQAETLFEDLQPGHYELIVQAWDNVGHVSAPASHQWDVTHKIDEKSLLTTVNDVRPVDILFVVDNSGSMSFERSNLAHRIDGMIKVIEGLDWQIAVTSTDASSHDAESDGKLIEMIGAPGTYVLDSSMDDQWAQNIFGQTVQNFPGGSGREEGIYVSHRVIERYQDGEAHHRQFLRNNADLAIVVLSDEDESSTGKHARMSPQTFLDEFHQAFSGQKNLVFHSIITQPGDKQCHNGHGAHYGNLYDELSRLTGHGELGGAIIGSVCEQDYTAQLADIGQSVKDLTNSIELECPAVDTNNDGTPEVEVLYKAAKSSSYSSYTALHIIEKDRIVFNDLLPPGDYKVNYKCISN